MKQIFNGLLTYDRGNAWLGFWAWLVCLARRPRIIAITGSVGKTTTKEMLAAVLMDPASEAIIGSVGKTKVAANSSMGVLVTLLQLPLWHGRGCQLKSCIAAPFRALSIVAGAPYPRTLVLEWAASHPGQLRRPTRIAPPHIAVVTAIGPSHLDQLVDVEGVAREKGTLVEMARPDGLVVLGTGHEFVDQLSARSRARVVKVDGVGVELSRNIARAVARHLAIPEPVVESALARFAPVRQRRIDAAGMTIIDDCYNANPLSMRHGLETLASSGAGRRKVAILGPMAELGAEPERYHHEIGDIARSSADLVIAVGDPGRAYAGHHWFESNADLIAALDGLLTIGDVVLVKASHSAHFDEIVTHLVAAHAEPVAPPSEASGEHRLDSPARLPT